MYYLDSDTCIEILRGNLPYAKDIMMSQTPNNFAVPSVVAAELYFGAENAVKPLVESYSVQRFLSPFKIVPFDESCVRNYASIRYQLKKAGKMIGPNDLIIAATALSHGAVLVSNNVKEFSRVPGLILESWAEVDLPQ